MGACKGANCGFLRGHALLQILLIAFLAMLCGAQHCSEMAEFGRAKLKFLKRFLKLRHGIPTHDNFSTVFPMLDPKALDAGFGANRNARCGAGEGRCYRDRRQVAEGCIGEWREKFTASDGFRPTRLACASPLLRSRPRTAIGRCRA